MVEMQIADIEYDPEISHTSHKMKLRTKKAKIPKNG